MLTLRNKVVPVLFVVIQINVASLGQEGRVEEGTVGLDIHSFTHTRGTAGVMGVPFSLSLSRAP